MATSATITQNIDPIYPKAGTLKWTIGDGDSGTAGPIKTANTSKVGAGNLNTLFIAGSNGSILRRIRFIPFGANDKTVARLLIGNSATPATANDISLWKEISLPATVALTDEAQQEQVFAFDLQLPANYALFIILGSTVVAGWKAFAEGGDY